MTFDVLKISKLISMFSKLRHESNIFLIFVTELVSNLDKFKDFNALQL